MKMYLAGAIKYTGWIQYCLKNVIWFSVLH